MADMKQLNVILIVRNNGITEWEASSYCLQKGELGIGYLENGNVIVKSGVDGKTVWKDCPQVEGVFEDDLTLTYDFGRFKTTNGSVVAPAKGMTTQEWILDALSEVLNPITNYPTVSLSGGVYIAGGTSKVSTCEVGTKIGTLRWDGTFTDGSYKDAKNSGTYGTTNSTTSGATGLAAKNVSWAISNSVNATTATTEDGTFVLTTDEQMVVKENANTYATITAKATLDASGAYTPLNNIGKEYAAGKINGWDAAGNTVKTLTANCAITGYRKPFWGVKQGDSLDISTITSAQVRALGNSGSQAKGFPTSLAVPAGSTQVVFAAKAGVYKTLTAKDGNAMNAPVAFTKVASGANVEGANGYEAASYDLWYVSWADPIASAKALNLTWS